MTRGSWVAFAAWAVAGAVLGLAMLSLSLLALIPVIVAVVIAARWPAVLRSGYGIVTGVGLALLFVAYLQRRGPGTTCVQTATELRCDEALNPWPWLIAGVALVVIGVVAHRRAGVHARASTR